MAKETVTGICHARGDNSDISTHWMLSIPVESLHRSHEMATEQRGVVLFERNEDGDRSAIVQNSADAVVTLFEITAGSCAVQWVG